MENLTPKTRMAAARDQEKFYRPKRPCPYGHELRYTATGACVECAKRRAKETDRAVKALLAGDPA